MCETMISSIMVVVVCCLGAAHTTNISDLISPCSFKDPQLEDCATIQGKALLPHMVPGIKDWGIPLLNPLFLPEIRLIREGGSVVSLYINITNSTHHGWRDIKFKHIRFDTQNLTLDADWTIANYVGSGDYAAHGNILQVPVSGKGFGTIKTRNVYETLHVQFIKEERNGVMHLKPDKLTTKIFVKHIHYDIKNLFGNEILSDIMNAFLNLNSLDVYQEVKPFIDEITGGIMLSIMQASFAKIPTHEMFRDVN